MECTGIEEIEAKYIVKDGTENRKTLLQIKRKEEPGGNGVRIKIFALKFYGLECFRET